MIFISPSLLFSIEKPQQRQNSENWFVNRATEWFSPLCQYRVLTVCVCSVQNDTKQNKKCSDGEGGGRGGLFGGKQRAEWRFLGFGMNEQKMRAATDCVEFV